MTTDATLPHAARPADEMQGHWLLARLGKRVLRPGGVGLTTRMLDQVGLRAARVVELAPGLGLTARLMLDRGVHRYAGVDADPDAARRVSAVVKGRGDCAVGQAHQTGLPGGEADVVVGEAMLTMQSDRGKGAIVAEAVRLLRPGGRYAIHELALTPDDLDGDITEEIRLGLVHAIRVNARPLTTAQWRALLESHGLEIVWVGHAPMALLQMRRNLVDEGPARTLRIVRNVLRDGDARRRVLHMRRIFRTYRDHLSGVAIVARKPEEQP
ncbi:class I SAM-dependent methyltransferase [Demequina pelophila]|uniref:class I SAM-dependent methyltransferase n=1 Tax=Demequina pelophila TaxID=1638984 RepID=UPI0007808F1A|nr:methyltransferase domain-containing protein [Demequina pelophila]